MSSVSKECGVCFEEVRHMKAFPCGHMFCVSCVKSLKKFADPDLGAKCPTCRGEMTNFDGFRTVFLGLLTCDECGNATPTTQTLWFQPQVVILCRSCATENNANPSETFEWSSLQAIKDTSRFVAKLEEFPPRPLISLHKKLCELYESWDFEVESGFNFDENLTSKYLSVAKKAVEIASDGNSEEIWKDFDPGRSPKVALTSLKPKLAPTTPLLRNPSVTELVNSAGYNISLGTEMGFHSVYYCGRYLSAARIPGSPDGKCGPNSGPQCGDCKAFVPLNSSGVQVSSITSPDGELKHFCHTEVGSWICSADMPCHYCKDYAQNPALAMASGIKWRLQQGLILTNSNLIPISFRGNLQEISCGIAVRTKYYGIQCCQKASPCMSCRETKLLNSAGFPVTHGTSPGCEHRFYCGRYLNPFSLPHTDGYCGPNNGAQCQDCLDFQLDPNKAHKRGLESLLFLLEHKNPLINTAGCPVTLGTDLLWSQSGCGRFYCGRALGVQAIPDSDGRCGSNNGPQCTHCAQFVPINAAGVSMKSGEFLLCCGRRLGARITTGRCESTQERQCTECRDFQRNPGLAMRKGKAGK